jgi:hypothetical protein
MGHNRIHDGRKASYSAGSQVISVTESTGEDHQVAAFGTGFFVPEHFGRKSQDFFKGQTRVHIAIGSGKNDDTYVHGAGFFISILSYKVNEFLRMEVQCGAKDSKVR